MREWLIAADDRTGAFEVAALFAEVVGPVTVTVGEAPSGEGVVDLASRALPTDEAARRAASVDASPSRWTAHKIDSTLRGNWAAEVLARQAANGCRLVVLPAWPALGRTCVGGVVHAHGEAVGSVPAHLPQAALLASGDELTRWLRSSGGIAVCDVPDTPTMVALARLLASVDGVMVAAPAGPLGALFAARAAPGPAQPRPVIERPAMVVCGSANAVSREQVRRVRLACPDVVVVSAPDAGGPLHVGVARALAGSAQAAMAHGRPATVVILGGDTAAALLGDGPRAVGGTVAPGMPWSRDTDGGGPLVITKAGGFGGPDALVELLGGRAG